MSRAWGSRVAVLPAVPAACLMVGTLAWCSAWPCCETRLLVVQSCLQWRACTTWSNCATAGGWRGMCPGSRVAGCSQVGTLCCATLYRAVLCQAVLRCAVLAIMCCCCVSRQMRALLGLQGALWPSANILSSCLAHRSAPVSIPPSLPVLQTCCLWILAIPRCATSQLTRPRSGRPCRCPPSLCPTALGLQWPAP